MNVLIVVIGRDRGLTLVVPEGKIRIGRGADCDLVLGDPGVAESHVEITSDPQGTMLLAIDPDVPFHLESGPAVTAALVPGLRFRLGESVLLFEEVAAPSEWMPELARVQGSLAAGGPGYLTWKDGIAGDRPRRERDILYAASLHFSRAKTEEELRQGLVELAGEGIGAARAILFIKDRASDHWIPAAVYDPAGSAPDRETIPYSHSVLHEGIRTKKALLCTDVMQDRRFFRKDSVHLLRLKSVLVVPIPAVEGLVGAFYADATSTDRQFTAEDLELVAAIANLVSASLSKLREHQDLSRAHRVMTGHLRHASRMTAHTPKMRDMIHLLEKIARTESTVLIRGESGTGKELAAAYLHYASVRADRPFVALNCAALSTELIESELFGHTRGAFTGAHEAREGRFVEAHTGTLFLDEIGEMALASQAKLLRVLESRQCTPVGSNRAVTVDVRILAGTNRDLEKAVQMGTFRHDLYFRLRVVEVILPPLRERREDIPFLVERFVKDLSVQLGKRLEKVSPAAMQLLVNQSWPGNVRELRNAIEMAMIQAEGSVLEREDLPPYLQESARPPEQTLAPPEVSGTRSTTTLLSLEAVERDHILRVLEAVGGNKAQAARVLQISKRTLYAKLERYGMHRAED